MPRKKNPHSYWVKRDYHSQNKQNQNELENEPNKIKLRSSLDIYNRLIHDNTLNINLNNVKIGYSDHVLGDQEMPLLKWTMIDNGGDIPIHHILYFVLFLNNGNRLILWDRKTKLDRLYCSGLTKKHQTLQVILNSDKIKKIQSKYHSNIETNSMMINQNQNDEQKQTETQNCNQPNYSTSYKQQKQQNSYTHNNNRPQSAGFCKFYGAGYCCYGPKCNSSHNADEINEYEQQWLNGKIIINNKELPLISVDSTFSMQRVAKQKYDYLLVLDLEGKDEIIEFPVILIDLSSMSEISRFHSWIRPTQWNKGYIPIDRQKNINYINPKSKAISFPKMLQLFHQWLAKYAIYLNKNGKFINNNNQISKSFICGICGNWDIKTQIPKQCKICNIELPLYFNQWMNIKDFALTIYPEFEPFMVKGMASLLRNLRMKLYGSHHLGMDDTYNIARIIMQFAMKNAVFDYTAYRNIYNGKVIYQNNTRRVSRYHTSRNRRKNNYFQYKR